MWHTEKKQVVHIQDFFLFVLRLLLWAKLLLKLPSWILSAGFLIKLTQVNTNWNMSFCFNLKKKRLHFDSRQPLFSAHEQNGNGMQLKLRWKTETQKKLVVCSYLFFFSKPSLQVEMIMLMRRKNRWFILKVSFFCFWGCCIELKVLLLVQKSTLAPEAAFLKPFGCFSW